MKPNCNCCNTECEVFTCCCLEIRVKNPHLTSRNFNSSLTSHSRILTDRSEANLSILTARSVKSVSEIELSVRSTNSLLSSVHKPKTSSPVVKASSARLLPKPCDPPQRTSRTQRNVSSKTTENTVNKSVSKNSAQPKKVIGEESNSQPNPVLKKSNASNFSDTSLHLNLSSGVTFKNELNTRRPQHPSRPLPVPQLSTKFEETSSFRKLPRLPD
ncbi:hypothetical protein ACJMK2_012453 [Sinanodonta woodiana]|uniref:Uncharacterized protein n=1 Tax=Sinanodonta woodiana TaxID=1069815 RepID=A0ABD3V8H6_SINWO